MDPKRLRQFLGARFSREGVVGLYFTASLAACAILAVAVVWLAQEVTTDPIRAGSLDAVVGGFLFRARSQNLTRVFRDVTQLGDHRFLLFAAPSVALALFFAGRRISALLFAGSVLGGFGLSAVLKIAVARARPDRWPALVTESTYSFPSGHTMMATVFFGGLTAVVFHLSADRWPRIAAVMVAAAVVLGVATSRVYLEAHWATDTLAGIMAGLIWVVVYAAGTEWIIRRNRAGRPPAGPA